MGLRKRVVKGFTDACLRAERRLVVDLLRNGRMTDSEWKQITEELEEIAEKYQQEEIGHDGFIQNRKKVENKICSEKRSKGNGLKGKEARQLYENYRENHQPIMEQAFYNSSKNTFYFLYRLPLIKTRYMVTALKLQ